VCPTSSSESSQRRGDLAEVPVEALRGLLRELHDGVAQEAAAARVALAVWRRAGDESTAREVEARLEALFDQLAALEAHGRELVRVAEGRADPSRPSE
jgi:signal transduction histidine kinase